MDQFTSDEIRILKKVAKQMLSEESASKGRDQMEAENFPVKVIVAAEAHMQASELWYLGFMPSRFTGIGIGKGESIRLMRDEYAHLKSLRGFQKLLERGVIKIEE